LVKDREHDTAAKVKPPLRGEEDRRALVEGADGTRPHRQRPLPTPDEKKVDLTWGLVAGDDGGARPTAWSTAF
jgi:hypothetical protein